MKKTGIMTDSHSGILENEASKLGIAVLPMPFYIDEKLYREGVDISREEFYEKLRKGADVATSQPSPESVMHMWSAMLQEYEELVYIPISSGLSGSCMTAQAMAQEEPYAGRVFVVDNGRVSTPMHRSVLDAVELAEKGYRAQKIKDILEKNRQHMVIYVGLSTLTYLKKGGRISSVAAVAADVLKIKPVMKFGVGKLDVYQKCRGMMEEHKSVTVQVDKAAGKIYVDGVLPNATLCLYHIRGKVIEVKQAREESASFDLPCSGEYVLVITHALSVPVVKQLVIE